ncbi:MAG0920 family protein [Mycoplasmopsis verecunda]|uniref:Uncharacterized protein n=1 Tax=Mycoplasmopsis verecunda TaxID=171291 RepID=A0A1T4MHK9_9BACT|nr:hypothetical protein [Mycoplasmopsis verecunda]WPB54793.1 hypothetical protein SAM46_01395 [Mycoplasmopsis verecunda]SJZ66403.1 hypothetical protein SAMN02745154_00708 [Mycoplasmopsis verecunda]
MVISAITSLILLKNKEFRKYWMQSYESKEYFTNNSLKVQESYFIRAHRKLNFNKWISISLLIYSFTILIVAIVLYNLADPEGRLISNISPIIIFSIGGIAINLLFFHHFNGIDKTFKNWAEFNSTLSDDLLIEKTIDFSQKNKVSQLNLSTKRNLFIVGNKYDLERCENKLTNIKVYRADKQWFRSKKLSKVKDKQEYLYSLMILNYDKTFVNNEKCNINMFINEYREYFLSIKTYY